jgi:hypothetical protein
MYSILIKTGSEYYSYDTVDGTVFTGNLEETKARYSELLQEYPASKLVVVHNTTVTTELTIVDAE